MKLGSALAIFLFALVALAHLARILSGLPVTVGTTELPMAFSVGGVIVPTAVAVLLWRESRPSSADA